MTSPAAISGREGVKLQGSPPSSALTPRRSSFGPGSSLGGCGAGVTGVDNATGSGAGTASQVHQLLVRLTRLTLPWRLSFFVTRFECFCQRHCEDAVAPAPAAEETAARSSAAASSPAAARLTTSPGS